MSIDSIALEHLSELPQTEINAPTEPCPQHAVFHFFPDDSKQYSSTTTSQSNHLIEFLRNKRTDFSIKYNMEK